ncbi:COBRA-like protein 10 [Abrus precatorius]|uniref:COBRA-like protein 10 n=1 Tax=Abrus precatorius TaxID=3816 RepID=A0A8B8KKD0_ABRPR|nr:COBRA-like protein 10 [Abrus precatorius]
MKNTLSHRIVAIIANLLLLLVCDGQGLEGGKLASAPPSMTELDNCDGLFLTYSLLGREKEFPHVKNVSKQAWAFKAEASLMNVGDEEVTGWKMFVGFQHKEILVSADGAVLIDAGDFPAEVGNGTTLVGNDVTDLKTAIDTAGDVNQMGVRIQMTGTQFGLGVGATPMPKTIRLENDGFKCPAPGRKGSRMFVCCRKDPKMKAKLQKKTKYPPRRYGDLTIAYDVLQAFQNNYYAQVTIDNNHPLGRLDHWNLTWEWQKGEFIYSIKGAYARKRDPSECLYGLAGKYYKDLDFSQVTSCQKKPILFDLPAEKAKDEKLGKIPWCCRNGTVLPPIMDKNQARSIFQLQVFKMPPDTDNRTALTPPSKWNIDGVINPQYKCSAPVRVDAQEFPDPSGLRSITTAVASWQIVCNITKPKPQETRCCVSFSAFYNESAIPCNTCACGCDDTRKCNSKASPLLLPPDALLVPFVNRTLKARAWAKLRHTHLPSKLPCGDNCPISINWHVSSDHKDGWTARITLFNWESYSFDDWFTAIQLNRTFEDFEDVYSFNGTRIPGLKTVFLHGLKGLNYLAGETNGTHAYDPKVPGKQQTVISFTKKHEKHFDIMHDGYPTKVFFNGEECALPPIRPAKSSGHHSSTSVIARIWLLVLVKIRFKRYLLFPSGLLSYITLINDGVLRQT